MDKNKLASGLIALVLVIGGMIGISQWELKRSLCGECNTTAECPECNTTADCEPCAECPEPVVCEPCPEPKPCPECPEPKPCPKPDLRPTYDSSFSGAIVYEDRAPYKRGIVRALGESWISYALTNDKGEFNISVKGESPFQFSAYSPWHPRFIHYGKKIKIAHDTDADEIYCTDGNETLDVCTGARNLVSKREWTALITKNTGKVYSPQKIWKIQNPHTVHISFDLVPGENSKCRLWAVQFYDHGIPDHKKREYAKYKTREAITTTAKRYDMTVDAKGAPELIIGIDGTVSRGKCSIENLVVEVPKK